MATSPLWDEYNRQQASGKVSQSSFGDAAAAYSNPGTKQVATSPLIRAAATAPKPPTVPLMQFAQSQQVQQSPAAPTNRVPLMQAAGIQPFSSQSDVRRVDNAISAAIAPSATAPPTSATRSLIDAAREVAPGVYNHGRGQYSDNPKGMGLIAAAGLGGAQTTPAPAQRMGLIEMARQQNASGTPAWSSADNATMAANLRDGVDLYRGTSQGTQNQPYTPPQDTGGYGLLDKNTRDLRNARLQAELMKPGARMALAGLLREQGSAADRMAQASEAAAGRTFQAGQNEADRALNRDALSTDAANNMARLGIDQQRLGLEASSPERQIAQQTMQARDRLLNATDPQDRATAAQQLAALEGRSTQSSAPAGYRWASDGQSLEAIPGSKAALDIADSNAKKDARNQTAAVKADQVMGIIDKATTQVGNSTAGAGGAIMGRIPGSTAVDLRANLDTIKANLGFDTLQAMRESSPTGGALGQVAVQELNSLQSTVASLDREQSPEQLLANLQKVRDHYSRWQMVMRGEMPPQKEQQPQQSQSQQRTVRRTGTMNGRRVAEYSDGSISYAD